MIKPGSFAVDPWALVEPQLHFDLLAQMESLFALSNGHIGLRGNLEEGEPHAIPGTYLNAFYESLPLPYAEAGYGYPEQSQTLINVTDGKLMRLLVDDEPFDVRYGSLLSHRRVLDLRDGVLRREVEWVSPAGQAVRVRTTRLVSFVQRSIAAVCYEVEPLGDPARIVVQSTLVANEPVPSETGDPRAAAALRAPLVSQYHAHHGLEVSLGHQTRLSGLRMAAGLHHVVEGPPGTTTDSESEDDLAWVRVSTELQPGQRLRMVKFMAYGWSSRRSMPALRDQVGAALASATRTGWQGLLAGQRDYLDSFWQHADVELEGDDELQQAVRFALFQVVQAGARAEQRAIPAKGLTGRGYDGHTFWDMEEYTLAVLTYTAPAAARDALLWRRLTLDLAEERAHVLRLAGAAFPWRTIRGQECSGYWPAGTAAFHVSGAVADAVQRYVHATQDQDFERGPGLDLLVGTARLWRSLGHHDAKGRFRIDGVTGPDEYTALVDNNTYTNLMAARNLSAAADAVGRYPDRGAELRVTDEEVASWRRAADAIEIPYDSELGITGQSEGFTRYRRWDFAGTRSEQYPLLLNFPYYLLYSSQVIKQADLVMALYKFGDRFTAEQKRRDFEHYEAITVRDSSLSAPIQAIVAAEVGHLDLAFDYFVETAFVDLHDLGGNTDDGLHLAALSGAWLVVVAGFGGMHTSGESLAFAPRLPGRLVKLRFRLVYRGRCLQVTITHGQACYELVSGEPLNVLHFGEAVRLSLDAPETRRCPLPPQPSPVSPPPGRAPYRRGEVVEGTSAATPQLRNHP